MVINRKHVSTSSLSSHCKQETNNSIVFNSSRRRTFSGLMAHFHSAPLNAATIGLLFPSLIAVSALSIVTKGSRPPFCLTASLVAFSSAHLKREQKIEKSIQTLMEICIYFENCQCHVFPQLWIFTGQVGDQVRNHFLPLH
jgi:hypothetical protein